MGFLLKTYLYTVVSNRRQGLNTSAIIYSMSREDLSFTHREYCYQEWKNSDDMLSQKINMVFRKR